MKPLLFLLAVFAHSLAWAGPLNLREVARAGAPAVLQSESAHGDKEIEVRHLVYRSVEVGGVPNEVYAVLAAPKQPGPHPALLLLHGGRGSAQLAMAQAWARRGYVAISPDLPGIADPARATRSNGVWKSRPYGADRWVTEPALANSTIFQALAAGIGAVRLLQDRGDVARDRIGIIGASWGGYATTLLAGLLGDEVRAAYAVWGSGYFDQTVFAADLARLPARQRARWQAELGAEHLLPGIRGRFFIAAATNDRAFYLPAVARTYAAIGAPKGIVFGLNADHDAGGYAGGPPADPECNWTAQEVTYFEHALKGIGAPLPEVEVIKVEAGSAEVAVRADAGLRALELHASPADAPWEKRRWQRAAANRIHALGGSRFRIDLDGLGNGKAGDWLVLATDTRAVSGSSLPQALPAPRANE